MLDAVPRPATRTAAPLALAALAGLVVGGLTLVMQGTLPGVLNHLSNSGAVWSLAAFASGALLPVRGWRAAVAGAVLLVGAVLGYYGSTTLLLHDGLTATTVLGPAVWAAVALVAGPVFGLAGAAYCGDRPGYRSPALGALGAVFVAEALYLGGALGYWGEAGLTAGVGLALPLLLGRSGTDRRRGLLAVAPWTLLAAAAEGVVWLVATLVFG